MLSKDLESISSLANLHYNQHRIYLRSFIRNLGMNKAKKNISKIARSEPSYLYCYFKLAVLQ